MLWLSPGVNHKSLPAAIRCPSAAALGLVQSSQILFSQIVSIPEIAVLTCKIIEIIHHLRYTELYSFWKRFQNADTNHFAIF